MLVMFTVTDLLTDLYVLEQFSVKDWEVWPAGGLILTVATPLAAPGVATTPLISHCHAFVEDQESCTESPYDTVAGVAVNDVITGSGTYGQVLTVWYEVPATIAPVPAYMPVTTVA
jgi:hypothetical protein